MMSGSDDSNLELSNRRAGAVRSHLAGRGVECGRLSSAGLGEGSPIAGNATATGRQQQPPGGDHRLGCREGVNDRLISHVPFKTRAANTRRFFLCSYNVVDGKPGDIRESPV